MAKVAETTATATVDEEGADRLLAVLRHWCWVCVGSTGRHEKIGYLIISYLVPHFSFLNSQHFFLGLLYKTYVLLLWMFLFLWQHRQKDSEDCTTVQ